MSKKTGLTIEKLSNGFLIGAIRDSDKLFSRNVELDDTKVAKTEQEVIEIIKEMLPTMEARERRFDNDGGW